MADTTSSNNAGNFGHRQMITIPNSSPASGTAYAYVRYAVMNSPAAGRLEMTNSPDAVLDPSAFGWSNGYRIVDARS